jgi:hypothetical protein
MQLCGFSTAKLLKSRQYYKEHSMRGAREAPVCCLPPACVLPGLLA